MEHILPKSPNPFIKNDADATPAVLGHINYLIDNLIPYKSYTGLITQTGNNDPTFKTLENNISLDFTWKYENVGQYRLTFANPIFVSADKVYFPSLAGPFKESGILSKTVIVSQSKFDLFIFNVAGDPTDRELTDTPIEIRVYK